MGYAAVGAVCGVTVCRSRKAVLTMTDSALVHVLRVSVIACALTLGGCADSSDAQNQIPPSSHIVDPAMVPDPASTPSAGPGSSAADGAQTTPSSTAPSLATPAREPYRDGTQLFIPGLGLVDETEFWHTYETAPNHLPASLDLQVIHQLKQQYDASHTPAGDVPATMEPPHHG